MKIVKYYQGVTSGSYLGRDDGYPETKRVTYDLSKEVDKVRFVQEKGSQKDEKYARYEETELSAASVRNIWANLNHELEEKHQSRERAEKMAKYAQLKQELGL